MDQMQATDPIAALETLKARLSLAGSWRESYSLAGRGLYDLLDVKEAFLAVVRSGGKRVDVHHLSPTGIDESPLCFDLHETVYGQVLADNRADYEPWMSSLVLPLPSLGSTSGALHIVKDGADMFESEDFEVASRLVAVFRDELHRFEVRAAEVSPLAGGQSIAEAFSRATVDQLSWL